MKTTKVFSAFHGMGCIGLALQQLGVKFELYASEIDKHATKVSDALFPGTINLGDITKVNMDDLPVFDLVVGGSPCQGFSFAGKQLNFEDPRSKLFFVFLDLLNKCKERNPNVKFLLENVRMNKDCERLISEKMGVMPLKINSTLVSAQNRFRLYWTNIGPQFQKAMFDPVSSAIPQPVDKGILLEDILEEEVDDKYYLSQKAFDSITNPMRLKKAFTAVNGEKALCLTANGQTNWTGTFIKIGKDGKIKNNQNKASCLTAGGNSGGNHSDMDLFVFKCGAMRGRYSKDNGTTQQLELRQDDKSNCLTSVQKDNLVIQLNPSKQSGGKQPYQHNRVYSPKGKSPCINTDSRRNVLLLPEATKKGYIEIEEGECFDATFIDSKTRRGRKMSHKSNCLTAANYDFCQWKDSKIRRLTPKECARLQTIPNWAIKKMLTCGVSNTQLYKMLGNGWTVDVIKYILSFEYKD